ncbi:MAG: Txe/YoeB family addiction module toxin [Planctomycetia bacterium]|nr:Txe/YoeB family addiction module toxin [Planctomycetia bacterium]
MKYIFTQSAYEQLMEWVQEDRKKVKKIHDLIKDIQRNGPETGIGKPESLKHIRAWSRRIDQEHRLVYNFDEHQNLIILSCHGHYEG